MDSEEKKVVFETDSWAAQQSARPKFVPGMVRFIMKYSGGYVKDEKQANYVLIGFVVLAVIISSFLIFSGGGGPNIPLPHGTKIIYPENQPPRLQERF